MIRTKGTALLCDPNMSAMCVSAWWFNVCNATTPPPPEKVDPGATVALNPPGVYS